MKFVTKGSADLASAEEAPEDAPYLLKPKVLALTDARAGVGRLLRVCDTLVELNWGFPLTKEKFRLLCEVNVLQPSQESAHAAILEQWRQMSEE